MSKKDKQQVKRAQETREGTREYTQAEIDANVARLREEEADFLSRLDECEVRMISLLIEKSCGICSSELSFVCAQANEGDGFLSVSRRSIPSRPQSEPGLKS